MTTTLADGSLLAGRYAYVRELGRGATGRVVLVRDTSSDDVQRAAKVVAPQSAGRLRWELSVLHGIAHPNLAAVHELLRLDAPVGGAFRFERGATVLIEDFAEGTGAAPVAEGLAGDERLVPFILAVARAVARALSAIHRVGLVHGDVKPDNIVVGDDASDAKLIDLGLAHPPGLSATVGGTPGYLAPEAWQGERSVATDLYALGATLHELLGGRSAVGETRSKSVATLASIALAEPRHADSLPETIPPALERLVASLLDPEPVRRPASAREVVARVAAIAADLDLPLGDDDVGGGADAEPSDLERATALSALPLIGRARAVERIARLLGTGGLIVIQGQSGAGRTRVVREAVRAYQSARAAAGRPVPTWIHAIGRIPRVPAHDAVVLIEDADSVDMERIAAAQRAAEVEGVELAIVLERTTPLADADAENRVELAPLGRRDVGLQLAAALGDPPDDALIDAALEVSGGLPGRLCRLLAEGLAAGADATRPTTLRELGAQALDGGVEIPSRGRPVADLLAIAGGELGAEEVGRVLGDEATAEGMASLVGGGVASVGVDGRLCLRPDLVAPLLQAQPEEARLDGARKLDDPSLRPSSRGFVLAALGRSAEATDAFLRAASGLVSEGDPEAAAELARRGRELLGGPTADPLRVVAADGMRARGRYAEAAKELSDASGGAAALLRADLLRLDGRPADARAEAVRARGLATSAGDRARAEAIAARTLLDEGRAREAFDRAVAALALSQEEGRDDGAEAAAAGVAALAGLYAGERAAAAEHAGAAIEAARRVADRAAEARARAVSAMIAADAGEIRTAAVRHAQAFELADAAGELHAATTSLVNVGLAHLDAGEPGPAIAALREGARRLARLGRDRDLCRVLYNLGLAAVLVGDDDLAISAVRNGREAAVRCGDRSAEGYARILEAEMALRGGSLSRARDATDAAVVAVAEGDARVRAVVSARQAMLMASLGDMVRAREALAASARACGEDGSPAAAVEERVAAARVALLEGDVTAAATASAAARVAAERVGTYEARLRALLVSADTAEAVGDRVEAGRALAAARAMLDAAAATLEPGGRARLREVAAYQKALTAVPAEVAVVEGQGDDRWRRLAFYARRLTAERRVGRLYEEILDAAIDLSGAERGFVVLRDDDGTLRVRSARGLVRKDLASDELRFSRSVASRAIDSGRVVSSVDASADESLHGAASVHALALRSVVAVPLRRRNEVAGAIYLDDRLRPGAFGPQDEALLADLADLASISLDGAELLRGERKTARRLAMLRSELAQRVETQAIEIASLKRAVAEGEADFPGVIAHSDGMRRTLALATRVASSEIPVLIGGESGTGKELVARGIHALGNRRSAAFVSENCGAIPEPLLESALFGHVRGAFTGADRARPGLFEAADGGTLFLDEIGEMSPGMQTKLLRAVQDGEIRPVGSETPRHVDVRIVAATHRDLSAMVEAGEFREDLFYRLAVVQLHIPALRERPDDVPPLIAHFVAKHAPGRDVHLDERAIARLSNFAWPGNVRQLENEVQRALVMAGDVIREADLSPAIREDTGPDAPDEMDLKGQIHVLERRLITKALDRVSGNQTQAAKLLGVSRYGLQKMMKRLGL